MRERGADRGGTKEGGPRGGGGGGPCWEMLCLHGKGILLFFLSVNGECEGKEVPLLTVGRERGGGGRTDLRGVGEGGGWTHRRQLRFTLRDGSLFLLSFSVRPSVGGDSKVTDRPTQQGRERGGRAHVEEPKGDFLERGGAGGAHE